MCKSVVEVIPLKDYKLLLTFNNNKQKIFDVNPYLKKGVFSKLRNPKVFKSVRVCFDSIAWGNCLDIAPETLYKKGISV